MRLTRPIETRDLILRDMSTADAAGPYAAWMRDPEVLRFLEVRHRPPASNGDLARYIEAQTASETDLFLAICLRGDRRHIGNIKLGFISVMHRRGDIGVLIGERGDWGKGYASQAIAAISDYGFAELGLQKITASFHADNTGSIRSFEKAGFVEEGRRSAQYFRDGGWRDEVLLARFAATRH